MSENSGWYPGGLFMLLRECLCECLIILLVGIFFYSHVVERVSVERMSL